MNAELAEAQHTIDDLRRRLVRLQGAEQALRGARAENQRLQQRVAEAEQAAAAFRRSMSWRITAPVRRISALMRLIAIRSVGWLLLKPASRPRRALDSVTLAVRRLVGAEREESTSAAQAAYYVFVDHTIACPTNTGVQRVARGMAKALLEAGEDVRFVKWDAKARACVLIDAGEREALGRWNGPAVSPAEAKLYPSKGSKSVPVRPARERDHWLISPEVTHLTFQASPVTADLTAWAKAAGVRTGFVFYDAIPLQRPEFADLAPRHAEYMRALRLADVVWPISRWSADQLVSFWGVGRDADHGYLPQIRPIHLPCEFDRPRVDELAPGEKLVLCVGTLEPRKNQVALIRAFQSIRERDPSGGWKLVLAGNLHPLVADEVNAAAQADASIEFLGYVPDAELSSLYERCAFTVFPSVDEGFGLPILESLWQGKPCLCADFGAMGEVAAGGGCLTVDVRDEARLAEGLERLMRDADLRRTLAVEAAGRRMDRWPDYLADLKESLGGEPAIYFWVDGTVGFPANTGIQRVTRQLARGLIEEGHKLIPVKWGGWEQPFQPVSDEELDHFSRWNGPPADRWSPWVAPEAHRGGGWFMMTELPVNLTDAEQKRVRATVAAAGLRSAAVFYDTIPWKMRDVYPEAFSTAHRIYMRELANFDRVIAISQHSRRDLVRVLGEEFQLPETDLRHIRACLLPAEFPERSGPGAAPRDTGGAAIEILSVGTIEPRKNHERLLNAFDLAAKASPVPLRLTIVGGDISIDPSLAKRVQARVRADPRVTWERKADDARVKALYERCDFTVYPSVEEGFGVPILESLWHGKPVVCADFGAMREVAERGGGCLMTDVRHTPALTRAIAALAGDAELRQRLSDEARGRTFRTWEDYVTEVSAELGLWSYPSPQTVAERRAEMRLAERPRLSVCISTYNRVAWLSTALRNIANLYPEPVEGVEFVICDNASPDETPLVVREFLMRPDAVFRRNPVNVGMLGNLRETALAANGEYVWIVGDDDLLMPGAVERVLDAIDNHPDSALIYLNYAYTSVSDARSVLDFDSFFRDAIPIVPAELDEAGPIREICARNENFFTAIYTLVFRRDHALKAYSQDTSGRPFSTMLTCIPTTYYVLNYLMDEPGVWIGAPQVVVNLNVSWMRYAPLWILERIPEVYEVALQKGVPTEDIDRWRRHTLLSVERFFAEILGDDLLGNAAYFSAAQLVRRFADLPEFQAMRPRLLEIYRKAHAKGHPGAAAAPAAVFGEDCARSVIELG
jgi:glycosyltransferase involved in cell wall biosynthesis